MIYVTKANGEKEAFDETKVKNSIKRAGIPENVQREVLTTVKNRLYDNIPTSEIYKYVSSSLSGENINYKTKYALKESIMNLGPTGYPFEDFISEILITQGYTTKVRQIVSGKCISHEIDIIAEKDDKKIMIEAKFHNLLGTKTDIHVALYTQARFEDVREKNNFSEAWIVTNTKTTIDSVTYALCTGLKIISWSYPEKGSLREIIESSNLIPVTALSTLSMRQKQNLMQRHIVLCKDIVKNPNVLQGENLDEEGQRKVMSEIKFLSGIK